MNKTLFLLSLSLCSLNHILLYAADFKTEEYAYQTIALPGVCPGDTCSPLQHAQMQSTNKALLAKMHLNADYRTSFASSATNQELRCITSQMTERLSEVEDARDFLMMKKLLVSAQHRLCLAQREKVCLGFVPHFLLVQQHFLVAVAILFAPVRAA